MKNCILYIKKILIITSVVFLFSCNSETEQMPYQYFPAFTINLSEPSFFDLNVVGGHVMVTGGIKGIAIYHQSKDVFVAYERCCPYDPGCGRVYFDDENNNLIDTCCNSEFSLILGGVVVYGPSTQSLRKYVTEYNPNNKSLKVYSDIQF